MDKKQRKAALQRWKHVARDNLLAAMPISPETLHRLLDYLDANLNSCDHTTKFTAMFLDVEDLEKERVLSWLGTQGGFCDCEVLANLEDLDDSLRLPAPVPRIGTQKKEKCVPRSLETAAGWNLANLPVPWRVANLSAPDEPIRLQLGKKGGCSIEIVEVRFPAGPDAADEFWARLWYSRTELPARGVLQVSRAVLDVPVGFRSTVVQSPSWSPVYCWIVPASDPWYLEVRTELNRCAGDMPQIASLISRLAQKYVKPID